MISKFRVLSAISLLAGVSFAQVPQHILECQKDFGRSILAAEAKYVSLTNSLPKQYLADLEKLAKSFQNDGDLDGILAVKKEEKRFREAIAGEPDPFETVPEMPSDAIVDTPEVLRKLQENYVGGFVTSSKNRKAAVLEAAKTMKARIEEYQKDLVKAGKLEEALAVKEASAKINERVASGRYSSFTELVASAEKTPARGLSQEEKSPAKSSGKALWQQWKYIGSYPFSKGLMKFRHPDVPDTMAVSFDRENGKLAFSGICDVSSFQCGSDFCTSVGKAVEWSVNSPAALEKISFLVKSKRTTITMKSGPQLQLAVFMNGRRLQMLNVPLISPEIEVQILRNPKDPTDFIFYWRGTKIVEHFKLTGSTPVSIVLGISFNNKGERCETTVELQ